MTELGHEVEEVAPPHDDEALARDFLTIWFAQLYAQVVEVKRRLGSPDSHFEADTLATAELGRSAGMVPLLRSLENVNCLHPRARGVPPEVRLLPHAHAGQAAPRGRLHDDAGHPAEGVASHREGARRAGCCRCRASSTS